MTLSQSAAKDCRSCCLRRIRCDRTIPQCIKCRNKGILCPGYGPRIRWTNAIASRGRFKGLGSPDSVQKFHFQPQRKASLENVNRIPQGGKSLPCTGSKFEVVPEAILSELLQYYATEIAPINVWVHSQHNEYKRLVIPLAKTQLVLQLAITGIAAAHKPDHWETGTEFSRSACQKAVLLITERIRRLAGMNLEEIDAHIDNETGTSEAVLAATLVLSNCSLLESDLCLALFHLKAARVLIKTLMSSRTSSGDLFIFLKNQVAALDILACTTLFSPSHIQDAVLPELGHGPVIFGHYLNIIHDITIRSIPQWSDIPKHDHHSVSELEDEFELAHGSTLMAAGRLTESSSSSYRRDVTRLVQCFHHAGLLYACKRSHHTHTDQIENHHLSKLFRVFQQFEDIDAFVANLSWPIFIGGICSCGGQEQMHIVRNLCRRLAANSAFKYYANILTFLEELWESSHHDWIVIAREWEEKSVPILAV